VRKISDPPWIYKTEGDLWQRLRHAATLWDENTGGNY